MKIFDYIYYRMTKFYFKWDGRTGGTAIIGIAMIQCVILLNVFALFTKLLMDGPIGRKPLISWAGVAVFLVLLLWNFRKYNGKYNKFKTYWKDEKSGEYFYRGTLVVLVLILPWILLAFIINEL